MINKLDAIEAKLDYILKMINEYKKPMTFQTDGEIMNYEHWMSKNEGKFEDIESKFK